MAGLAAVIGAHEGEIRRRWREAVVQAAASRGVTRLELADHLATILADIAGLCDTGGDGGALIALYQAHQATELRRGFDLEEAVSEYLVLGRVLTEVLGELPEGERPPPETLQRVFLAVGATCAATVRVFFERVTTGIAAERRLLRTLDDLSNHDGIEVPSRWVLPALDALLESVGAPAGALFLFDQDSGRLSLAAARGLGDVKPFGHPALVALVAEQGDARTLSATDPEPAIAQAMRHNRMADGLAARLFSRGRPVGVLYVASDRPRTFGFLETRRFLRFAGRVAGFVDLARLDQTRLALLDRLEGEVRLRQEAMGHLGHDLRGHLAAIRLTAQAMEGHPDDPARVKTLAARIAGSVDAADRQLEDVLLANRIGSGERLPLHPAATDLGVLVREVVGSRVAAHRAGIEITVAGDVVGELDADLVRRAVRHLVDNACRHGARDRPVEVAVTGTGPGLSISLHNWGPAVAPPELRALVAPLSQRATRRAMGLGLTLVQGCAAAHGGEVTATSDADAGTTFVLALPRQPPST